MTIKKDGIIAKAVKALSEVESNELKATLVSALFVFILMASYYILRSVRDSMASDWSDSEVSLLWNINFFLSAGLVAVFGFAVSRAKLRNVIPSLYGFFAITFVAFYFGISFVSDRDIVDKLFYLWVSVFALFNLSVFWTLMADTFNPGQAKRLFGVIMAGSSSGALVGPAIAALFADVLGTDTLTLIASVSLTSVIPLVFYLYHLKAAELGNADLKADTSMVVMGGNWWQGFRSFATNPYLIGIGIFILLYSFISSFIYFEQKNLLTEFSRAERVQILGSIDWIVNLLTLGMATFLTGRIVTKLGMPTALAVVPFLVAIGLLILAFAPILTVLLALQVFRRGANYGLTRPAREILYTRVSKEDKFKTKPVVDIVVYRGGDAVSSDIFAAMTDGFGLGIAAVAIVGSAIALAWGGVGVWLGKQFDSGRDWGGS